MLEVKGVTKSFGGLTALRNLSLKVRKGAIQGLIGPNGAGKTTALNVISGVYHPDRGKIYINGNDVTTLAPHQICKKGVSRTFQIPKIFPSMTSLENVMIGSLFGVCSLGLDDAKKKAADLLEFVGLAPKKNQVASSLTLVERKFLEVARALATDPQLLLLDEVAAGLNEVEIMNTLKLIEEIHESGKTIIIVEHIMKVIMSASNQIIVLHHGEEIAEGTPEEIANDKRVIAAYLGRKPL